MRPVWERAGQTNQLGRKFPALTYDAKDARDLFLIEDAPRTVRGARDLLSVGLQYGNAFERDVELVQRDRVLHHDDGERKTRAEAEPDNGEQGQRDKR